MSGNHPSPMGKWNADYQCKKRLNLHDNLPSSETKDA